ncbi:MAG: TldD/PmbA family protein [Candidatus ainarchaeum sp.]|nr:TldD/PmbA family protein [Candidatus ainarchaeum sp.]
MAESFEDLTAFILKAAEKRFDEAVVHAVRSRGRLIKFTNGGLSAGRLSMDQTASVFVAKGKKVAVTALKELESRQVEKSLAKLEKFVAKEKPNPEYGGIADSGFRKMDVMNLYDPRVERLTGEELSGYVSEGVDGALSRGAKRASGTLETGYSKEILRSSGGAKCSQKSTSLTFSLRAFSDKDASGHKVCVTRALQHFKPWDVGVNAGDLARESMNPRPVPAGKMDVLFDPMAAAVMMQHVGEAASIFSVEAGFSFLEGKLNKKVGSDILTVFDDGTLPGGMASTNFDAEGIPAQKTTLIRFGVLRNYLHSTGTAKRYGVQTTGNAGIIHPRPWNVVVDRGNYDVHELVRETRKGVFVTNMWYMRFQNYRTGEFSAIPRDAMFYVENGRIAHPVKGLRLSDSMPNLMGGIEALSEKREQVFGWEVETPVKCGHMLARGMRFTKSTAKAGEGAR